MANFNIVVDTNPMAQSIDNVSYAVSNTTLAVGAMETAVIEAERQAAQRITDNVDRGFYSLIQSKLSSKLAEYYTEMNAKVALLMEISKTLASIETRMEKDVNRLKAGYYKTFQGLDKDLDNRISQLDKPTVGLAAARDNLIYHKNTLDVPHVIYANEEIGKARQLALTARLNSKTDKAIYNMTNSVQNNMDFNKKMKSMISDEGVNEENALCVPVIYVEEESYVLDDSKVSMLFVPEYVDKTIKEDIESKMEKMTDELVGNNDDLSKSEIKKEFENLVMTNETDQEVIKKMMELFERGSR